MRPLVENTRETSLTNTGEARINEVKRRGGDKFVHCQLQQMYRVLGTPKTVSFPEFASYPMGPVYHSKFLPDAKSEVECRFRVPKIIGKTCTPCCAQCVLPPQWKANTKYVCFL